VTDDQVEALIMDLAASFRRLLRISEKAKGVNPSLWLKTVRLGEETCKIAEHRNHSIDFKEGNH